MLGFREDESMHLFCCRCSLSLQPELCERMTLLLSFECKEVWAGKVRKEQSQPGELEGIRACTKQLLRDAEHVWP